MWLLLGLLAAFVIWLIYSLKIVKRNERGVIICLGKPAGLVGPGLRLVIFPIERLLRITTTQLTASYEVEVITVPGYYEWESKTKDGKTKKEKERVASTKAWLNVAVYWFWPRDKDALLKKTIPHIPSFDPEEVAEWMAPTIIGGVKAVGGQSTWRRLTQETNEVEEEVTKEFTEKECPLTPLGLEGFRVEISKVTLPEPLSEALNKPEIARHQKKARIIEAEGEASYILRTGSARVRVEEKDVAALKGLKTPVAIVKAAQRWGSERKVGENKEK